MIRRPTGPTLFVVLLLALTVGPAVAAGQEPGLSRHEEIDAQVWALVSKTVEEHDIETMATVYHPDAVLVSARGSSPIGPQLERWGDDMVRMRAAGTSARVAFRFSERLGDGTTAFETGIFRYATVDAAGVVTVAFVRMEALLVRQADRWRIVMERQLGSVDEAAWAALAPSGGPPP